MLDINTILVVLIIIMLIYIAISLSSLGRDRIRSVAAYVGGAAAAAIGAVTSSSKKAKKGTASKDAASKDTMSAAEKKPRRQIEKISDADFELGFADPKNCKMSHDIINGKKTVEGRKKTDELAGIKAGNSLSLRNKDVIITCEVTDVREHDGLAKFLKEETVAATTPCVKTAKEAEEIYKTKFGIKGDETMLAIELKPKKVEWRVNVPKEQFAAIKSGKKTVEARINGGKWLEMKPGQSIIFKSKDKTSGVEVVTKEIKKMNKYKDFKELLDKEGVAIVNPGMTVDSALKDVYSKIYTEPDLIKEKGTVAIVI